MCAGMYKYKYLHAKTRKLNYCCKKATKLGAFENYILHVTKATPVLFYQGQYKNRFVRLVPPPPSSYLQFKVFFLAEYSIEYPTIQSHRSCILSQLL